MGAHPHVVTTRLPASSLAEEFKQYLPCPGTQIALRGPKDCQLPLATCLTAPAQSTGRRAHHLRHHAALRKVDLLTRVWLEPLW